MQSVEGTPLPLGGAAGAGLAHCGATFSFTNMNRRREILVERAPRIGITAPLAESEHLQYTDPIECDGDDVASPNDLARGIDPRAVDTHMTFIGERRRRATRPDHPRVPEPLIDALPIQSPNGSSA
jgi:hypothetical protein